MMMETRAYLLLLQTFLVIGLQPCFGLLRGASAPTHSTLAVADLKVEEEVTVGVEKRLPALEKRVREVFAHLNASRLSSDTEEPRNNAKLQAIEGLARSLAFHGEPLRRFVLLHEALAAAQRVLEHDVQELTRNNVRLSTEIREQEVGLLYAMLRQRRTLPLNVQLALLRRQRWANCTYAQRLLQKHHDGTPLYYELEEMLTPDVVRQLPGHKPASAARDHLAAAGSDGRVHIVSSRLMNMVASMARQLTTSRDMLQDAMRRNTTSLSQTQREQLQKVIEGLNATLEQEHKSNDLKANLETMYRFEAKLAGWMKSMNSK